MKIFAIDASTKSSGIAIFENKELLYHTCCTASSNDLIKRIQKMTEDIKNIIQNNLPIDKIILEEVLPEGAKANVKTHKALMWLQASIAIMVHDNFKEIEIEYIYPNSWRAIVGIHTGRGIKRASLKDKDINFVKDSFNIEVNDDEADAILIGLSQTMNQKKEINWE